MRAALSDVRAYSTTVFSARTRENALRSLAPETDVPASDVPAAWKLLLPLATHASTTSRGDGGMANQSTGKRPRTQGGARNAGGGTAKSNRPQQTADPGKTPGQAEGEDSDDQPDPTRTLRSRDSRLRG